MGNIAINIPMTGKIGGKLHYDNEPLFNTHGLGRICHKAYLII